jgi:predicted DNA-binding transcriptional regulator YafY
MEHDAPISYDKANRGYYYEDPNFTLADIPLTPGDMEAIEFAAKTLLQFKDNELFKQFGSAIDKIADRVTVSKSENAESFVQFETNVSSGGSEFLGDLLSAIKRNAVIEFDYGKFTEDSFSRRRVLPLLLKQYRNRWYLVCYELVKKAYRTFALDRIDELILTDETLTRPSGFNPDNYFKYSVGITSGEVDPSIVKLTASPLAAKYLDSLPIHSTQRITKMLKDGSFEFELKVVVTEEFIREILAYGGSVRVDEPEFLQHEIKSRAIRILHLYDENK